MESPVLDREAWSPAPANSSQSSSFRLFASLACTLALLGRRALVTRHAMGKPQTTSGLRIRKPKNNALRKTTPRVANASEQEATQQKAVEGDLPVEAGLPSDGNIWQSPPREKNGVSNAGRAPTSTKERLPGKGREASFGPTTGRNNRLLKDTLKAPGHAVTGTYVLLSGMAALILLPFSPPTVPPVWTISVALATIWNSTSSRTPHRRRIFDAAKSKGTNAVVDASLTSQYLQSYILLRASFDNYHLVMPNFFGASLVQACDLSVAIACLWPVWSLPNGWAWDGEDEPSVVLGNVSILVTNIYWTLFFVKPAWLNATLAGNSDYNIALAFMIVNAANAAVFFFVTLQIRNYWSRETNLFWTTVFIFGVAFSPPVIGVVCGWPAPVDLALLHDWFEAPSIFDVVSR